MVNGDLMHKRLHATNERYEECRPSVRKVVAEMRRRAPHLGLWWVIAYLPTMALCFMGAYHGLQFYVQLRVRGLGVRCDGSVATVFERDAQEEVNDNTRLMDDQSDNKSPAEEW